MGHSVRVLIRHLFIYSLYLTGSLSRAKRRIRSKGGRVVLTFHRVLPDRFRVRSLSPAGMFVSDVTFESLVRHLSANHQIIPLAGHAAENIACAGIPVAITFDDGWQDNADFAQPILSRFSAKATIFICPEMMGQDLPFWPEQVIASFRAATLLGRESEFRKAVSEATPLSQDANIAGIISALKQLPSNQLATLVRKLKRIYLLHVQGESERIDSTMSWETARKLADSGVAFGSHTLNHKILTGVTAEEAYEEIATSRDRVAWQMGAPCTAFAYPNGDWSPDVRTIAASSGYTMAFANSAGVWSSETDVFAIPRVNLWEGALTGLKGRFSRIHFEYAVFWRSARSLTLGS